MNCQKNLILAGLRVYRILEISRVLAQAAVLQGLDTKTAEFSKVPLMMNEVAHVRIGENIYSPLILKGRADILICFEPIMAVELAAQYLSSKGLVIMNTSSLLSSANFSSEIFVFLEQSAGKTVRLDILKIAEKVGICKSSFVMLGVLDGLNVLPINSENFNRAVKGVINAPDIETCLDAMEIGKKLV